MFYFPLLTLDNLILRPYTTKIILAFHNSQPIYLTYILIKLLFHSILRLNPLPHEIIKYLPIRFKMIKALHGLPRSLLQVLVHLQHRLLQPLNPVAQSLHLKLNLLQSLLFLWIFSWHVLQTAHHHLIKVLFRLHFLLFGFEKGYLAF